MASLWRDFRNGFAGVLMRRLVTSFVHMGLGEESFISQMKKSDFEFIFDFI